MDIQIPRQRTTDNNPNRMIDCGDGHQAPLGELLDLLDTADRAAEQDEQGDRG